jgi:hypothetical protein
LETGRELPTGTQLYVAVLAPMIGVAQVDGTVAIARRAVAWRESPLFAAHGQEGSSARPSRHVRFLTAPLLVILLTTSLHWPLALLATSGSQNLPIHGLRPVIGALRVALSNGNSPVRPLLASLR